MASTSYLPSPGENDILFLCEGESDTLAVRDSIATLDDRRVFALGLPGAATWRSEWASYLKRFATLYVVGDGDEAGHRMAARVITDVPWARPIWMPENKDARNVLQSDPDDFLDLIAQADTTALRFAALMLASKPDEYTEMIGGGLSA